MRRGTEVGKVDSTNGETADPFKDDDDDDSHVFRKQQEDSDDDEMYRPEGEVDVFASGEESGPG